MHCINIYITKDDGSFSDIPHLKLPQDFVLFTEKPKGLKQNRLVAYCATDYFGGCGDQTAIVWDNKKRIYGRTDSYGTINEALRLIGVKWEDGKDEFDTIGFGDFRDNQEINELIYNSI